MNQTDVIIVGGGVSGLMCAREFAKAGLQVRLLERQALAKESSWAGGGILSPLKPWQASDAITRLCRLSQAAYPRLAVALYQDTGIDPEWLPSGLLFADCPDRDMASQWAEAHACPHQRLNPEDIPALEPNLGISGESPFRLPAVAQVRNPRLLRALRTDLERRGVELLEYHAVDRILLQHDRLAGVISRGQRHTAENYVLTAGAWTGLLAKQFGLGEWPIAPVKGQMLIYAAPPGLLNGMVISAGRYLIPRKDGKILAGSTVEYAHFNKSNTDAAFAELSQFATSLLPALQNCPVEKHWAGLRPGSPDGIPSIGPHPAIPNLFFNCGHFRNGFVMAPASASLLASQVLRQPPPLSPEDYLPKPNGNA